jgi:hypothetical protein
MRLHDFFRGETGAVTVDWVVLTAWLVGLGLAATTVVSGGLEEASGDVRDTLMRNDIIRSSFAPGEVLSDMADGIEGWAFTTGDASAGMVHDDGPGSDGQPGFMRFTDGGRGGAAYLAMPEAHAGDQSRLMGGSITFDMNMISGGQAIGDRWPILRIEGANGEVMTHTSDYAPARGGWSAFSADVAEGNWEIDGRPATRAQMEAILADVATSELRIEQAYGGNEIIGLDNVRFVNGR